MSIAWGSIVILIVLLPGFLFFVGLYFPEQFTRETSQRSPLGQLAGSLLVAFAIHGALYCALELVCGRAFAIIATPYASPVPGTLAAVHSPVSTCGRFCAPSSSMGTAAPRWMPWLTTCASIVSRFFSMYWLPVRPASASDGWWELSPSGVTCASSRVTPGCTTWLSADATASRTPTYSPHVAHAGRGLVYRGTLTHFGLRPDGRFSYLVLGDATRYYMYLDPDRPRTSDPQNWRRIGESAENRTGEPDQQRVHSFLVIEGEDIANLVFDRYRFQRVALSNRGLDELVTQVESEFRGWAVRKPIPSGAGPG